MARLQVLRSSTPALHWAQCPRLLLSDLVSELILQYYTLSTDTTVTSGSLFILSGCIDM
jgi:hypothetical protein